MSSPRFADLTPTEQREYRRLRAEGTGARLALRIAGKDHGGPDVPIEHGSMLERDGFRLTVKIERDHLDPSDTGIGFYTSAWEDGATLDRKREGYHVGRDQHPYFRPEATEADHRRSGATREEARRYVLQDLARAEAFGDEWHYIGICLTAEREGVELAQVSVWGVATDEGDCMMRHHVDDLAGQAIEEARDALKRLCGCHPE